MADSKPQYVTLVQHSGYGYAGKPSFRRGIEICYVHKAAELKRIQRVGGFLFEQGAIKAEDFEDTVGYPPGVKSMAPQCRGTFSTSKIGSGLLCFIGNKSHIVRK